MGSRKKIKVTSKLQRKLLLKIMEENKPLSRGCSHYLNKEEYKGKWKTFAKRLNQAGSTQRDVKGWEKVWYDLVIKVKKKIEHNKKRNSVDKIIAFSVFEEKIVKLLNFTTNAINKIHNDDYISQNTNTEDIQIKLEQIMVMDVEDDNITSNKEFSNCNNTSDVKVDLLKQQLARLEEIKGLISFHGMKHSQYLEKMCNFKEEKLNLYKNDLKNVKEYRSGKEKWKKEVLEYKKQKLQIMQMRLEYKQKELNDINVKTEKF